MMKAMSTCCRSRPCSGTKIAPLWPSPNSSTSAVAIERGDNVT
jgi:hypothetical protein